MTLEQFHRVVSVQMNAYNRIRDEMNQFEFNEDSPKEIKKSARQMAVFYSALQELVNQFSEYGVSEDWSEQIEQYRSLM